MRHVLILFLFLPLLACGFEPMQSRSYKQKLSVDLSSVRIDAGNDRMGQLLKAQIESQVNPQHHVSEKLFQLLIKLNENESALFINPDGTSSRGDLYYSTSYEIRRIIDNKLVDSGSISRVSSYNTSENADYASFVSLQDARLRGTLELAEDYKLRLANLLPQLNNPHAKAREPLPEIPALPLLTTSPNENRRTGY